MDTSLATCESQKLLYLYLDCSCTLKAVIAIVIAIDRDSFRTQRITGTK